MVYLGTVPNDHSVNSMHFLDNYHLTQVLDGHFSSGDGVLLPERLLRQKQAVAVHNDVETHERFKRSGHHQHFHLPQDMDQRHLRVNTLLVNDTGYEVVNRKLQSESSSHVCVKYMGAVGGKIVSVSIFLATYTINDD